MTVKIFPYRMSSKGARLLARNLGVLRVHPTYRKRPRDFIINWGSTQPMACDLNSPQAVAIATNKLLSFQRWRDAGFEDIPEWTTDYQQARAWLLDNRGKVYCRTLLTSREGNGIIVAETAEQLVHAPLYTLQTKCKYEYRVHVFNGRVIDATIKRKRSTEQDSITSNSGRVRSVSGNTYNPAIRNHNNGWVFCRSGFELPLSVGESSTRACAVLGLNFGAVDIGFRERDGRHFVYEVNTAPGLEGTTLERYTTAIRDYCNV